MNYNLLLEQETFFAKNCFIEADELLSIQECDSLKDLLNVPYKEGRDLFRKQPLLQKLTLRKSFAYLASNLLGNKPLRFAFSQVIGEPPPFLEKPFQRHFCIHPLEIVLLLRLSDSQTGIYLEELQAPQKKGSGVFFEPHLVLNNFYKEGDLFYLIGYTSPKAIYKYNALDPCTHVLKWHSYSFGDFLQDAMHPLLFR